MGAQVVRRRGSVGRGREEWGEVTRGARYRSHGWCVAEEVSEGSISDGSQFIDITGLELLMARKILKYRSITELIKTLTK